MTGEQPFEVVLHDVGSLAYGSAPHCPVCTRVLDEEAIDPDLVVTRRPRWGSDIGCTYDGAAVVTDRFVGTFEGQGGLRFVPLPAAPGHHQLIVDATVAFPIDAIRTFGPTCEGCGEPTHVIGGAGADLSHAPPGLSRSDLGFGDTEDRARHPTFLGPRLFVDASLGPRLLEDRAVDVILERWLGPDGPT